MEFEYAKNNKLRNVVIYVVVVVLSLSIFLSSFFICRSYLDKQKKVTQGNIENEIIENIEENEDFNKEEINNNEKSINENTYFDIKKQSSDKQIEQITRNTIPVWHENANEDVRQIYFSEEKQVYLTFDDGPSILTPQILDILKEEDVKATFFVVGSKVDLNPQMVKREYNEGHYIANHGYTHIYSSIYTTPQTVLDEYLNCEQSIKNALNNQDYNSFLFRFPGGSSGGKYDSIKSQAKQLLKDNNIAFTNWNCLTGDAEAVGRTPEQLISRLNQTIGNQKSLIVLMHDAPDKQATVDTLRQIIQKFKNEGYTFKNFYDIFSEITE